MFSLNLPKTFWNELEPLEADLNDFQLEKYLVSYNINMLLH